MKKLHEFKSYFENEIVAKLAPLEDRRIAALRKKQFVLLGLLLILLAHAILIYLKFLLVWTILISVIALPILGGIAFNRFYNDYSLARDFRWTLAYETVGFLLESSDSTESEFIKYEDFRKSQLFIQEVEHYVGNGLGKGTIGGAKAEFSVLEAAYQRPDQDDWVFSFRGVFIVIHTAQNFDHKAQILPCSLERDFGIFGEKLKKKNFERGYGIKVEHEAFAKDFVAYCTNRSIGRELFDEDLAEVFANFYRKTSLKPHASFIDNKIYVAIQIPEIVHFTLLQTLLRPKWAINMFDPLRELLSGIAKKV